MSEKMDRMIATLGLPKAAEYTPYVRLLERAERAEAALEKLREECNALSNHILDDSIFDCEHNLPCVWQCSMAGDDSWYVSTTCRETLLLGGDGASGEGYRFCPYCGHPVKLATPDSESSPADAD